MDDLQGNAPRAAWRWYMLGLFAAAFSCLPTEDLSSYSNEWRPLEPDAPLTEPVPAEPAPGAEEVPASGAGADVAEDPGSLPGVALAPGATEEDIDGRAPALASTADAGKGSVEPKAAPDAGADAAPPPSVPPVVEADADAGVPSCASGALVGPGDRCFQLLGADRSWNEARSACRALGTGWDLATIRDAARNTFLTGLLGANAEAWVGATDAAIEGTWLWVGDTAPFWLGAANGSRAGDAYVNWLGGGTPEPNGGEASDCLRLRAGGAWADLQCTTLFPALCEGPRR